MGIKVMGNPHPHKASFEIELGLLDCNTHKHLLSFLSHLSLISVGTTSLMMTKSIHPAPISSCMDFLCPKEGMIMET
jgi:hypothetical protein